MRRDMSGNELAIETPSQETKELTLAPTDNMENIIAVRCPQGTCHTVVDRATWDAMGGGKFSRCKASVSSLGLWAELAKCRLLIRLGPAICDMKSGNHRLTRSI